MKSRMLLLVLSAVCLLFLACGGAKKMTSGEGSTGATNLASPPAWFSSVPSHKDTLYAAATATSKDLQLAIDKATLQARTGIGEQISSRLKSMAQRLITEAGEGVESQLSAATERVIQNTVNVELVGSKVMKQSQTMENGLWRCYVLVSYPIGAANAAFVESMKREQVVRARQDLQDAVQRMHDEIAKNQ
ncbi:MAG: LPP20 family lipoprotein [candidate division KSB1 bacterium]|nr:LPP20 family lipoprotein [candidate division KSB1 bacterium]MDZ7304477.1 LPP20 family lipoprotein [candidate division KSB1 bacterium]MDZ7312984.1 LPP20 family lipoprotein [candidate division KSB1 bacterium]